MALLGTLHLPRNGGTYADSNSVHRGRRDEMEESLQGEWTLGCEHMS